MAHSIRRPGPPLPMSMAEGGSNLFELRQSMVRDLAAGGGAGAHFNGANPARFGHVEHRRPASTIRPVRPPERSSRRGLDDEVGLFADDFGILPAGIVGPDLCRREILLVAERRAFVTHFTMVAICLSERERSFAKLWMPMVWSRCHGGMFRVATRCLMDLAHGRTCFVGLEIHRSALAPGDGRFRISPGRSARRLWRT